MDSWKIDIMPDARRTGEGPRRYAILSRILWWFGLILLIPAVSGFSQSLAIFDLIAAIPPEVSHDTQKLFDRMALITRLGFLMWAAVAVIKLRSFFVNQTSVSRQRSWIYRIISLVRKMLVISITVVVGVHAFIALVIFLTDWQP